MHVLVAFAMYDLNKNGYITRNEFKVILNMMVGSDISSEQVTFFIAYLPCTNSSLFMKLKDICACEFNNDLSTMVIVNENNSDMFEAIIRM